MKKVTPSFQATPLKKLRSCQAPLFENLVGGSTLLKVVVHTMVWSTESMPGAGLFQTNRVCLFISLMFIYMQKIKVRHQSVQEDIQDQRKPKPNWLRACSGQNCSKQIYSVFFINVYLDAKKSLRIKEYSNLIGQEHFLP